MACCHQAKSHYLSHVNPVLCYYTIWCLLPGHKATSHYLNQCWFVHYDDVIMGAMASQITSLMIVYSTVYSDADQRKHQSSVSLAFVRGIQRRPVDSLHKWPVTQKMFPFHDVIMLIRISGTFVIICSYMYFLNQCCELGTWEWPLCENIGYKINQVCSKDYFTNDFSITQTTVWLWYVQNFNQIWIMMEKSLVYRAPGLLAI